MHTYGLPASVTAGKQADRPIAPIVSDEALTIGATTGEAIWLTRTPKIYESIAGLTASAMPCCSTVDCN